MLANNVHILLITDSAAMLYWPRLCIFFTMIAVILVSVQFDVSSDNCLVAAIGYVGAIALLELLLEIRRVVCKN